METSIIKNALTYYKSGFNCAQAVLAAFSPIYQMDEKEALRLACGFGGGARAGELCGAVSGAVLVIGLKYGQDVSEDTASKLRCYEAVTAFHAAFRSKAGNLVCKELLGADISTEEGMAYAQRENLFPTTCLLLVKTATEILIAQGYANKHKGESYDL